MQYLIYILAIPFIYLNYKIIVSDIKNKIIPNKYLAYLLSIIPIYYIYLFLNFNEINYLLFFGQILITLVISFVLYYYSIWAAGDAKYLLVLSLFIPFIGIVPFIGNIALITIFYLLCYFIWFYFGKCIFIKGYAKNLKNQIKTDLNEKWKTYKNESGGKNYFIVLKWIIVFLLIFVSIRISRIYLFSHFFEKGNAVEFFRIFIDKYHFYLIIILIILFVGSLYIIKLLINKLQKYILNKFKLDFNLIGNIFLSLLFFMLISFIIHEYIINTEKIINLLFLVFTLYIGLYIVIKILIYSYRIIFNASESFFIKVNNLRDGDNIDKNFIKTLFLNILKFNNKKILKVYKKLDFSNIKEFKNDIKIINKECTKDINIKKGFNKIENIKILKSFSFAPYILIGFLLTYVYSNIIIVYLLNIFLNIIQKYIYL